MRVREESNLNNMLQCLKMNKIEPSKEDIWSWNPASNGMLSMKKAYTSMFEEDEDEEDDTKRTMYKSLCGSLAPRRVQAIVKKMLKQRPIKNNMAKRSIIPTNGDLICTFCGDKDEDSTHLFFDCGVSTKL